MQVFLVVCYRSDASFPFRVKKKRWWDREKKKKKKLEKELFPPLLRCTTAMHAFGVYICLFLLYEEHIETERQDKNRE